MAQSPAKAKTTTTTARPKARKPATRKGKTGALTAPGTRLHVGQTALVDFDTNKPNGSDGPSDTLKVTITSIVHGSMSAFKGSTLTGVTKGSTPTYVRLRMTNVSRRTIDTSNLDPAFSIGAIQPNGDQDSALIIGGDFPPCPNVSTPTHFQPGQTFTTCETFMEHGEAKVIGYNGSLALVDSPVTWSP